MATELPVDEIPADTTLHAKTTETGTFGDKRNTLYVPGEGIYLSKHGIHDLERDADKQCKEHTGKSRYDNFHQAFIDEETIEHCYKIIQQHKTMKEAADKLEAKRKEYEERCYPGTDTQDPTKQKHPIPGSEKANSFQLDRSQSTILLCVTSGNRYLNGSSVPHSHYVHIRVESPDGREVCDVSMTFDQFASFLVSNAHTPCTLDSYWSINEKCVKLREVVKEPENINARMKQRLNDRLDELDKQMQEMRQQLTEQIATGKAMSKTKLEEFEKRMGWFMERMHGNRDFTVLQAQEEVSSIVEQAACAIAWEHKLTNSELMASTPVRALVSSWTAPLPALPPAQEPKE